MKRKERKAIIYMAINNGWLQRDPFYGYSITPSTSKTSTQQVG